MHASTWPLLLVVTYYGLLYVHLLQNCLNVSYVKFMPASENNFLGKSKFSNTTLDDLTRSLAVRLSALFYNRKLPVVIYKTQKSFDKYSSLC